MYTIVANRPKNPMFWKPANGNKIIEYMDVCINIFIAVLFMMAKKKQKKTSAQEQRNN